MLMNKHSLFFLFVGVLIAIPGLYYGLRVGALNALEEKAGIALQSGDYLASLVHYSELENRAQNDEIQQKTLESKDLLVAQEIFAIAQNAAEEGEWFEVKALLERSDATTNTAFKEYKSAIDLYLEAAEKVKEIEKKIEAELFALKKEAEGEKAERREAEGRATQSAEEVLKKEKELQAVTEEKQATESELKIQKAETDKAKIETEKERLKKFGIELGIYVQMLEGGVKHLNNALVEIDNNKDTSALIFINQGKVLFNEARRKGEDLFLNRTAEDHKDEVQKLFQAAGLLVDAGRSLGSAVLYIDDKESEEFKNFLNVGKENRNTGLQLIGELHSFTSAF